FFQAEDGIRDRTVTGVQTCALPISTHTLKVARIFARRQQSFKISAHCRIVGVFKRQGNPEVLYKITDLFFRGHSIEIYYTVKYRSEERRVGKECRFLWGQSHEITNL